MTAPGAPVAVTFLGTGDAFSAAGSHQAGYLVEHGSTRCLLDCGSSTLTSMKRQGISPAGIDLVLISHLHGDHFGGLPYFFLEYRFESARTHPLCIAGPPGIGARVQALFAAAYKQLASEPLPFELQFAELMPEVPAAFGSISVLPFRVPHQTEEVSLGYCVRIGNRLVVYSGDTGWTEDLIARSAGADLFICECCFFETRVDFHLDYPRLAAHRERFTPKRFVLTHLGREVLAHRDAVAIEMAHDGLRIEL